MMTEEQYKEIVDHLEMKGVLEVVRVMLDIAQAKGYRQGFQDRMWDEVKPKGQGLTRKL